METLKTLKDTKLFKKESLRNRQQHQHLPIEICRNRTMNYLPPPTPNQLLPVPNMEVIFLLIYNYFKVTFSLLCLKLKEKILFCCACKRTPDFLQEGREQMMGGGDLFFYEECHWHKQLAVGGTLFVCAVAHVF